MKLIGAVSVETDSVVDAGAAVEASAVLTRVGNLCLKLVGYTVTEERELELAEAAVEAAGMLDCELGKLGLIAEAVLEEGFEEAAEDAAEFAVKAAGGEVACVLSASFELGDSMKLIGAVAVETDSVVDAEAAVEASGLIAEALLEAGFTVDGEDAAEEAAEFAPEAAEIVAFVLSASFELKDSMKLIGAVSVETDSVVDAGAAVEASAVLTRVGNLCLKLVGYTVTEERELELAEAAVEAAGMLDCELGKLGLIAEAVLEEGFEEAAEDAAEFAVKSAGGEVACVLSASFELGDSMKLIGAVAVETDSVVDAEAAVEASAVLTRVGNLCLKLVRYAVPEERELELAEVAIEAAGILSGRLGKFELIAAAVLEAEFPIEAEDIGEIATEVAAEVAVETADGIRDCVLSASFELEDSMKLIGAVGVETISVVDAEAAVEASGVLTRVGNLSFKLVGYAVTEEEETEPAVDAVDAAGMLDCEFGKFGLIAEAVLEAGFTVGGEDAADDAAEEAAEVAVESADGILACVLSASPKLEYPLEPMPVIAVEKDSVVDAEAAVEAFGVLTRVGNFCFKLLGYAVPEDREIKLSADAVDAAGMLDCEFGKFGLIAEAVLEAGFTVGGEDAADNAAEETAEVAPEAAEILACVLSPSFELEDPMKLIGAVSVEADLVVDAGTAVEASGVLARVGNLSFKLVGYAVPEDRETKLSAEAVDAAGMLDCEFDKLELIAEAVLETGLAVDAEIAAEVPGEAAMDAGGMLASVVGISIELKYSFALEGTEDDADAEDAPKAAGILACVLSTSLKLVYAVELMSAIAVVVEAEAAVESSHVLARVGNLSFKLVGYAVPEEEETEPAEDAVDAAGMLDFEFGKFGLIAEAVLEAGFTVGGEDAADDAAEEAAEVAPEAAEIVAFVLSASFEMEDSIGAVAVEVVSVIDAEAAVEASDMLTRVGNLSFKLVGYDVPEERETELAETAVDSTGMLSCVLGKSERTTAAVLETRFSDDCKEATMLVCVLGGPFAPDDPFELSAAAVPETGSAVDTEENVEASDMNVGVRDPPEKCSSETLLDGRFELNADIGLETAILEL
ncbi:hypothetical protein E4U17_006524 [Claviceps sp. LM77 group G4]|nr:hypothetical protein E4U17_006524 [Claviceps sp. LM77 group G4]